MNITIVNEDKVIVVDGEGINLPFTLADNIWAIQWNGTSGEVEYSDGTPHLNLTDFNDYQYLVDSYATEKQRLIDVEAQEKQDSLDAMTYADKRATEYPSVTDYLDGIVKGDTAQVDKYIADCQAVKDAHPKETI